MVSTLCIMLHYVMLQRVAVGVRDLSGLVLELVLMMLVVLQPVIQHSKRGQATQQIEIDIEGVELSKEQMVKQAKISYSGT